MKTIRTASIKTLQNKKVQVQIFNNGNIISTFETRPGVSIQEYIPILNNSLDCSSLSGYIEAIMDAYDKLKLKTKNLKS